LEPPQLRRAGVVGGGAGSPHPHHLQYLGPHVVRHLIAIQIIAEEPDLLPTSRPTIFASYWLAKIAQLKQAAARLHAGRVHK